MPVATIQQRKSPQHRKIFECVACGYTENADVVGAMNVLTRGQAIVQA
nr:transposase [Pasteurella multocida]